MLALALAFSISISFWILKVDASPSGYFVQYNWLDATCTTYGNEFVVRSTLNACNVPDTFAGSSSTSSLYVDCALHLTSSYSNTACSGTPDFTFPFGCASNTSYACANLPSSQLYNMSLYTSSTCSTLYVPLSQALNNPAVIQINTCNFYNMPFFLLTTGALNMTMVGTSPNLFNVSFYDSTSISCGSNLLLRTVGNVQQDVCTLTTLTQTAVPHNPIYMKIQLATANPFLAPSLAPSHSPSHSPSRSPSHGPSHSPSHFPSYAPSRGPSKTPTNFPTKLPTKFPTSNPSKSPSTSPTTYAQCVRVYPP